MIFKNGQMGLNSFKSKLEICAQYRFKIYFFLFLSFFSKNNLICQNGPAGVGTNTASVNQNRFWLKGDVGVYIDAGVTLAANSNSVQQWNDQSGVGNNATQATASRKPIYKVNAVNGLPALRFKGTSYVTAGALPSIANNVGYTYLIVFQDTAFVAGAMGDGAGDYLVDRGSPSPEGNELTSLKITSTNKYGFQKRDGGGGGLGGPVSTSTVANGSFRIIDYRQIPGATKVYDLYLDGTLENSVSSADANYVPPAPQIGHHYQPANGGLKGYVAEVIIYNYNVNEAQMYILNSYLAAKYGLTLTSNDKYVGDNAGNGNYDFEVAGVGKDATGSNLSAASSISGGLEITQSVVMENTEYLVYGHAAGTNSLNGSDISGMSAGPDRARWQRIWYLDWTHAGGTDETVNLTFDMSDGGTGGTPVAPLTNYKLLFRAGLAGAWTEVMNASSIAGDRVTFNGLAWNTQGDGYYTIGTLNNAVSPLPVELIEFMAEECDNKICLNWSTASEKNSDYFLIEKSIDVENWKEVCYIKAAENSNTRREYSCMDENPLAQTSYYRLKTVDKDKSYEYSKIITTTFLNESKIKFVTYPNPSKGEFTADISGVKNNSNVSISLINQTGTLVYKSNFIFHDSQSSQIQIVPTEKLSKGIYHCNLQVNNTSYKFRVVVD